MPRLRLDALLAPLAFVFTAALWAFCHPYSGILGDVNIYLGRAVADLDPTGVGRDLMFVNDGQSKFSLFFLFARPLVAAVGVANASTIIAAAGSACWFAGLLVLARALASGRAFWAIVITVSVLPVAYGYPGIFGFAETSALPRPFAEAAVMAALAAMLSDRPVRAAGFLLLGAALHPLMTIPGIGVALVLAFWQASHRLRLAATAALAILVPACIALGWIGCPLFDRLFTLVDAKWMAMLSERSPHLFVTQWTAEAFPPIIAQVTAILVAARTAPVPQRRLFLAVLLVGVMALAAAALLADEARLLLFVQVQTWRVTWLLGVIGGCALAYSAPRLWGRDDHGRVVLALLAFPWLVLTGPIVALGLAVITLGLAVITLGLEYSPSKSWVTGRIVICAYAAVGVLALQVFAGVLMGYLAYLRVYPVELPHLIDPLRNNLQVLPVLVLTAVWLFNAPRVGAPAVVALGLAAVALVTATGVSWDQRRPFQAVFSSPLTPPGFADLSAGRPQEVLWLDARGEPWFMLGRPQYLSPQQGVSMVFSRPLAVEWHARAQLLVDLGLAQKVIFRPGDTPADDDRLNVTQAGLDTLCRRPDAPGLVFVPIKSGDAAPALRDFTIWTLPDPEYVYESRSVGGGWRMVKSIAIVPCHPRAGVPLI